MTDCPDFATRDVIPDYLHGGLPETARERVAAHVAHCRECADELLLLQQARQVMHREFPVDVSAIVRSLPRPPSRPLVVSRPRYWAPVTALAAALLIAVGLSQTGEQEPAGQQTAASGNEGLLAMDVPLTATLSTEELESVILELESIEALPSLEPEPVLVSLGEDGLQ